MIVYLERKDLFTIKKTVTNRARHLPILVNRLEEKADFGMTQV
ncbi:MULTISPECIES: hypothetical protein [Nostocales]|uniref:Uncharacterized protein n=2 Tax=Nostocales TaxID=1161 RepID=A0ABW8WWZ2_9CYAN|nr:hypothetical protein [Tolypothrix bouteillei]